MKLGLMSIRKVNKTWIVLGGALSIGTIAALLASSFLSTQIEEIAARGKGATVDVIVAKTDISKDSTLSKQNLAVRRIPVEFGHSSALKPDDFARVDGLTIAYKVNSGEMILWSLMAGKKAPTFSSRVATGQRAITVAVDEISSISGMLEPGDVIDLIFSVEKNGRRTALPLLQSVPVMATGQRSVDDPKSGERTSFATVTLNATPHQAQSIIIARETGKLTALLRNPEDKLAIGDKPYDLTAMLGTTAEPRHRTLSSGIPVLYGGSGAKFLPAALNLPRIKPVAREPASPSVIASPTSVTTVSTVTP